MKTVVFDLNGTLTESKIKLESDMAELIRHMLEDHEVAIISGSSWKTIQKQVISNIGTEDLALLNHLYVLPVSGNALYKVWSKYGWIPVYENVITQKKELDTIGFITRTIIRVVTDLGINDERLWGPQIDNRVSQVTWSALGQKAPLDVKLTWDPDNKKRIAICAALSKELSAFDVKIGGLTSIDVTMKGFSKKYGVDQLMRHLHISKDDVVFVGNGIFDMGNDFGAVEMGLESVKVSGVDDTKKWILDLLDSSKGSAQAG